MQKIRDLQVGAACDITLVVKSATARETKAKKPYLALVFYDGVDTIPANYWDWSSGNIPDVNSILDVVGQVTEWQGTKQLNVKSMRTNTTYTLNEFMPSSTHDVSQVYKDAYALACDINDEALRTITLGVLDELQHLWLKVPGAISVHHNYIGGTLVHSYETARYAQAIAAVTPDACIDLCVAGALLHDVGKLFTYKLDGITIDKTTEGMLYEHSFIGAEFIGNFAESHLDCDSPDIYRKVRLLRHIILSHHGELEYGAAVTPMCIEAFIVNAADGLSATTEQVRAAAVKTPGKLWTDRIYTLNNTSMLTPESTTEIFKEV